jgi:hypothetical protein
MASLTTSSSTNSFISARHTPSRRKARARASWGLTGGAGHDDGIGPDIAKPSQGPAPLWSQDSGRRLLPGKSGAGQGALPLRIAEPQRLRWRGYQERVLASELKTTRTSTGKAQNNAPSYQRPRIPWTMSTAVPTSGKSCWPLRGALDELPLEPILDFVSSFEGAEANASCIWR